MSVVSEDLLFKSQQLVFAGNGMSDDDSGLAFVLDVPLNALVSLR